MGDMGEVFREMKKGSRVSRAKDGFAVLWKYGDGSGCGVVRCFEAADDAHEMVSFLEKHCDGMRQFWCEETIFVAAEVPQE